MAGTVNTGGSSMPPSKKVVVISKSATTYGTPAPVNNTGTGVTGTPLGGGAPSKAPSQTMIVTGGVEGVISKDIEGQQGPATGLKPPPASHGSTGPIEAGPSVDYDSQQGDSPAEMAVAQHRIIAGEQDQQMQDKAGA